MAGTPAGFNADAVRAGLKTAMAFGAPEDVSQRATFYIERAPTSTDPTDSEGVPFSPTASVTKVAPTAVLVDCAIQETAPAIKLDAYGYLASDRIQITLLDVDYAKVQGFSWVVVGGNRFDYRRTLRPSGLGPITVYTVECEAVDVS